MQRTESVGKVPERYTDTATGPDSQVEESVPAVCIALQYSVRCPVLIVSPDERTRLVEIRDNLAERIAEAEREGWFGDVEGFSTTLAAAEEKIAQLDARQEHMGSPSS
ncbi:hypothetical protein ACWGPD_09515 [Streptomyces hirsutus]|uniref:hypothetical protein n=1 Tax=Streptomyces hirsutus TaxID=35620 RepID=UPI00362A4FA6